MSSATPTSFSSSSELSTVTTGIYSMTDKLIARCLQNLNVTDLFEAAKTSQRLFRTARLATFNTATALNTLRLKLAATECHILILENLPTIALLNYARTSTDSRALIMDLFLRKTRQRIASFSLSPEWLLRTMKRTRSVIGGSIPFHLIVNDRFTPSNLDLYAPASQEERLLNIFQTEAGFSLIDSSYARIKSVRLKATHRLEKGRSIRERALLNFGNIPDTRHMELVLLKYKSRGVWHGARTDIPKDLQHQMLSLRIMPQHPSVAFTTQDV
ncbi:hypothetical protein C8J57DRAFT_1263889 [Mycena rebaudengoi]|nr:hypothetical protein C8J57DRAFT_1263889 [Mycena rebaudengoi]